VSVEDMLVKGRARKGRPKVLKGGHAGVQGTAYNPLKLAFRAYG
jgi:hypothetical protein